MSKLNSILLNHRSKFESENQYANWHKGAYNFLLQRTLNGFYKASTSKRRSDSESKLNTQLPLLTDKMLIDLYIHASQSYL